jgi:arylsulfatase
MRVFFFLALMLSSCLTGCRPTASAPASDAESLTTNGRIVVLLTLDTLRYDAVFGPGASMPLLAERLERGLSFDQSYSATSTTQPSHASMFTGLHPWRHGVVRNGYRLEQDFETVAERLRDLGWKTGAVVASYPLRRGFGFEQGFDDYDDRFSAGEVLPGWRRLGEEQGIEARGSEERFFAFADDVVRRAERQLEGSALENRFLWVHFFDAHDPYGDTPGSEQVQDALSILRDAASGRDFSKGLERAVELYKVDCTFLDRALESFLGRLEELAAGRQLHVLLVADHGESLGLGDDSVAHGTRVTSDQVHVPMAVLSPEVDPGRSQRVVGSVDVAPTLLDLALGRQSGLEGGRRFGDGVSILAQDVGARPAFGMRQHFPAGKGEGPAVALKFTRLDGSVELPTSSEFFVRSEAGTGFSGNEVRLEPLPAGAGSISSEEARLLFARFEQDLLATLLGVVPEISEQEREALEALGYVP